MPQSHMNSGFTEVEYIAVINQEMVGPKTE